MPVRLAQHLVQRGLLPAERVNEALRRQTMVGGAVDTLLLEQGVIAEPGVLQAMADVAGVRPVNLADFEPNYEVAQLVPQRVSDRLGIVPLSVDGRTLHVASVYPPATNEIAEVGLLLGKQVEIWVAVEARIRDWHASIYKQPLPTRFAALLAALDPSRPLPASALLASAPKTVAPRAPEKKPELQTVSVAAEDRTLEESLTRDMVEQLARNVAEEPILLKVKKSEDARPASDFEPTVVRPAPRAQPGPEAAKTWEREETRALSAEAYAQFARETKAMREAPAPATPPPPPPPAVPAFRDTNQEATNPSFRRPKLPAEPPPTVTPETRDEKTNPFYRMPVLPPEPPAQDDAKARARTHPSFPAAAEAPAEDEAELDDRRGRTKTNPSFRMPPEPPAAPPPPPPEAVAAEAMPVEAEIDFSSASPNAEPTQVGVPAWAPESPGTDWGAAMSSEASPNARGGMSPSGMVVFPGARDGSAAASVQTDVAMPAIAAPTSVSLPEEAQAAPSTQAQTQAWSLADARAYLQSGTSDREYIIDIALRFALQTFDFACAFAVVRGAAIGWDARGDGIDRPTLQQLSIPLDAGSVFRTVALTRGSFVGPLPQDQLTWHFLGQMGRSPRTAFLFPLEVKGRLIALVYGDCGSRPMSQRRLSEFILFCQDLPGAFQELILSKKKAMAQAWADQPAQAPSEEMLPDLNAAYAHYDEPGVEARIQAQFEEAEEADTSTAQTGYDAEVTFDGVPPRMPLPLEEVVQPPGLTASEKAEPPKPTSLGWGGAGWGASAKSSGVGRSATMPVFAVTESERPPPDFRPILARLVGPDAADRSRALAELQRSPEASAKVLADAFPGPTAWSRLPVVELPEPDELGPIPGALARLGRAGAQALAPLLDSDNSDARYLALLTAGNLPYPELVGGVLRGLFDYEPDISSAARAAASSLKRLPRFDAAMKDLRKELAARDPLRKSLAARALGQLHDRESVDGLINLTGSDNQLCAQAAAEALKEITRANLGTQARQWLAWWAENRDKRRVEWVVAALRHRELDVRQSAIEELLRAVNDTLGYIADASPADREAPTRRWEALISQTERGRKFEL